MEYNYEFGNILGKKGEIIRFTTLENEMFNIFYQNRGKLFKIYELKNIMESKVPRYVGTPNSIRVLICKVNNKTEGFIRNRRGFGYYTDDSEEYSGMPEEYFEVPEEYL